MNEWSPGGNYSCPGTPSQSGKSLRIIHDESGKGAKPLIMNSRVLPESRSRHFVQHSMEDVTKGFSVSNKKATGNGTSDPRFKRVVPVGVQNDACVGTETKIIKSSYTPEEKTQTSNHTVCMSDLKPNKTWVSCIENSNQSKPDVEHFIVGEDHNFNQSHDLKEVDKLLFDHDLTFTNVNSVCHLTCNNSESECTLNTRTTSLVSEESAQEPSNTLGTVMSPTGVRKVENWIHHQGPKLEKKHSVITVIGQMQEPDILSSALQEIDKRRKLAKELDRYAICKKIIETDKEKEFSDLWLKISSLNNSENYLFCGSNETLNTTPDSTKDFDKKLKKKNQISNNEENVSNSKDLTTDSSVLRRNTSVENKIVKCKSRNKCMFREMVLNDFPSKRVFCILIAISGILFWFAFFSINKGACLPFDLFNSKPKPITWYERIFKWLWEFFRPSKSYHRTSHWHSY